MTFLEQIKQQGRKEGRVEGFAKGLLDLLVHRFGPVPKEMKKRIAAADEQELRRWILRVPDAASIEDALGVTPSFPPRTAPPQR